MVAGTAIGGRATKRRVLAAMVGAWRGGPAAGLAALTAVALTACSGNGGPTASPTPAFLTGRATGYVITLDQLKVADFKATEPVHPVDASEAAAGDAQLAARLTDAGLVDAARAEFFRDVNQLSTANGPIDVRGLVLRFGTRSGAHQGFVAEVAHTDSVQGMQPRSAGVLGDEAHGDVLATLTAPDGTPLVEATVIWRNGNLVEVLVIRGRRGGTGLDDALVLAHGVAAGQH